MAAFRVLLIALALTAPAWALAAIPAHACSCAGGSLTLAERLHAADVVVVGQISNVEAINSPLLSETFGGIEVESQLDATEYLRGSGPPSIIIGSRAGAYLDDDGNIQIIEGSSADCGFSFELGRRYLLYFDEAESESLRSSSCTNNKLIIQSEEHLAEFRQLLQEPLPQPTVLDLPETGTGNGGADSSLSWQVAMAAAGALLAASASAALVAVRRRY